MRTRSSMLALIVAMAAGAVAWSAWNGAGRAAMPGASGLRLADQRPNAVPVDVELVLAVDVSYSMDPDEQALQREGYITGIDSRPNSCRRCGRASTARLPSPISNGPDRAIRRS